MILSCWLAVVAFAPLVFSSSPGVEVRLTMKGLEYGEHRGTRFVFQSKKIDRSIIQISSSQAEN